MCHSPDLAPSNYHLSQNSQKYLHGQRFLSNDKLKYVTKEWLKGQSEELYFTHYKPCTVLFIYISQAQNFPTAHCSSNSNKNKEMHNTCVVQQNDDILYLGQWNQLHYVCWHVSDWRRQLNSLSCWQIPVRLLYCQKSQNHKLIRLQAIKFLINFTAWFII